MWKAIRQYAACLALIQVIVAILGSLYFSEVLKFAPCTLCWYQRILMYPLVVILMVGIYNRDKKLYQYVLPFSLLGLLVSFYQVLLQQGIIIQAAAPCAYGVSCTNGYTNYLGFITIPLMSLAAFLLITSCILITRRYPLK